MDSHHIPQATCGNRSDEEHILHEKDMLWLDIHTKQLSPSFQHCTGRHAQLILWFHVPWHGATCLRRVAFRGGSRKPVDKGVLFIFNGEGSSFWHFWEASPLPPKNSISWRVDPSSPQLGDSLWGGKKKTLHRVNNGAAWMWMHTLQAGAKSKGGESPGMGTEQGSDWM